MAVTAKQRAAFWRLFSAACAEQGLAGREEREEYRHGVMMAEAGAAHLADVTRCKGFEAGARCQPSSRCRRCGWLCSWFMPRRQNGSR